MINVTLFVIINTMRGYELVLILNTSLAKDEQEKILVKIKKIIEDIDGKVGETNEWGKRGLTYPVKKQKEGIYFLLTLELPGKEAKGVEEKLKLEEAVLRHLLVRKE